MTVTNLIFVILMVMSVLGENPGFKASFTQKGLNYANQVALDQLSSSVTKQHIDDVHGHSGKVDYSITSIQITGFNKPSSSVNFVEKSNAIYWTARGASISLRADFRYKYKNGWFKISDHGHFDGKIQGVNFDITVSVGKDSNGRPTVTSRECSTHVDDVDIHFHGGAAWVYNLFRGVIGNNAKKQVSKLLCPNIEKAIDSKINKKLAKLKVVNKLGDDFLIDYRLIQTPHIKSQYMDLPMKGEVYQKDEGSVKVKPSPMPDSSESDHMLYLYATDYIMDTLGYVAHKNNILEYTVKQGDLPPKAQQFFSSYCPHVTCLGTWIPQINKLYPNSSIGLALKSDRPPILEIFDNKLLGVFSGNIKFHATTKDAKKVYLFTANVTMDILLTPSIRVSDVSVTAKVSRPKFKVVIADSKIGNIKTLGLQYGMTFLSNGFLIPHLNEVGQKGIKLQKVGDATIKNPMLVIKKGLIVLATDLEYTPK